MLLLSITIVLTGIAAVTDWRRGVIPNWLTLPVIAGAPFVYLLVYGTAGAEFSALGILGAGLVPYAMFRLGALGGGDVKLFAALGALHGLSLGLEMLIASLLVSCAWALVVLARRGALGRVLAGSLQLARNGVLPARYRRPLPEHAMTELRMAPLIMVASIAVLVIP